MILTIVFLHFCSHIYDNIIIIFFGVLIFLNGHTYGSIFSIYSNAVSKTMFASFDNILKFRFFSFLISEIEIMNILSNQSYIS